MKSITNISLALWLLFCFTVISVAKEEVAETPRLDAAEPLTPDDLYQIALKHNPDHQKNIQNASLNGVNTRSAWGTIMPSVDVGFGISQSDFRNPTYVESDGTVSSYPITETIPEPYVSHQSWSQSAVQKTDGFGICSHQLSQASRFSAQTFGCVRHSTQRPVGLAEYLPGRLLP